MTNTWRAYAKGRSASSHQQGKKGGGIMKLRQRRNLYDGKKFIDNMVSLSRRRKLRGCKKPSNNTKAGQIRKSSRLIDKGYTNRFYEAEGGLEIIKAPYGNGIMHGRRPNDDDEGDDDLSVNDADNEEDNDDDVVDDDVSDDNDDDDDGDHYIYNNYHHDGDWMPKSYKRNQVHHTDDDYHNHEICSAHLYDGPRTPNVDVNNGNDETHHHHRNNCSSNPDIDNANNEVHHHLGHGTPNANADNGYDGTNQQNDYDMTLAHSHDDNAHNDYQIPSDCDNMPPNVVAYCRRKKRTIGGILKDCDYTISQRQTARCRSKKRAFPSWICKKPRVFRRQQDKRCHRITIMANGIRWHCESNTTVQHHANHNNSMHIHQMWEHDRNQTSHSMAASELQEDSQRPPTTLTPLQPNSSDVALATVLEALGSADSELTRSPHVHSTDATLRLHMTHGAKIPSPQVTKEVGEENWTDNVKNEAPKEPTQKPKRKKHRPKVQRDIFHKARRMAKDTKIKVGEQRGDGIRSRKPRAKKGQVGGELTGKPSMRISKKRSHMQGGALSADDSDTLKDENVGINCLCGINKENSLIPVQSTVLQKVLNEFRENDWLQNLTASEVPYSCDMLTPLVSGEQPGKGELTMCTHMMEGQFTLNLEIIKWFQGNKLARYGHFLRQQSQPSINESRLPLHFESTTMGTHALSLVRLKPEDSTPLLLAEEPHNQLEMVVYDQKREMVVSKSAKLRTKIRAKVQLDVEHERIWPLLVLGGIPTDFEDIHYWNKERELMKRRVEVFIHKMQSVQGDRHFSPWKGSILDSVVGAFLTQNVSDHLSSSAFMSVASRYPSKQRNGAENTCNSVSDGANTENKCALKTSGISCEVRSDMQDRYKISSGLVHEEFLQKQGNFHLPYLEDHGSTTATCETSLECAEFSKHLRPSSSLCAVKTLMKNIEGLQPIGTRNIENQSNLNTPIITATKKGCVLPDEDCTRQTGMQDMVRAFPNLKEGKIPTKESDISISSLSDHQSVTINHAVQSDMKHLEIVPPQLIEENTPMKESDISMSHHTSRVVDYTAQSCMQHLETDPPCLMEEDISMKPNDISISSVSHHNGIAVKYTWQSGMQHLERSSSLLGEKDVSTKASEISSSIIGHHTDMTVDYRGQSGTQHLERASTSFMEENISTKPSDISNSSLGHHNSTGQSCMNHLERDSHPLVVGKNNSMTPCISHICSIRADHTGESGMQRASTCLMEEDFSRKSKDISISCLGHQNCIMIDDCRGRCGTQHLTKALQHLTEEEISMEQCNHSNSSSSYLDCMTVKHNLYDVNDGCTELLDKEKNCSSICSNEVSCKHPSVSSPLEPRELVRNSNTNTALQEVRASIDEHHAVNQCTMDNEGWQCPGRRTKVYQNSTVCRSLFKDDVPEQINVKATTLLNTHIEEHRLNNSNTAHHTDAHLTMIQKSKQVDCGSGIVQSAIAPSPSVGNNALSGIFIHESKQVDCGSDLVHSALAPSPSLKIVGNKRRPSLSGIERAHLEENQNGRKRNQTQDWESVRKRTLESCSINENTCVENLREDTHCDSVDWDAVRRASVEELAETIKERGMHHVLSGRIKAFLKTLQEEQGNLDLEWIRKVSPENAKAYLMGIRGLGVKSVECIRLLSLHHVAFPVDVNVGRICVRLGWVPIEPLPEQLQLHLLELYPVQETIQKYLWPRLLTLDQKTLYELHYQLITFGKVFCTKSRPNCNACPMRTECKHFASAYASAKLLLTGSNEPPLKSLCSGKPVYALTSSSMDIEESTIVDNEEPNFTRCPQISEIDCNTTDCFSNCHQFYIEEPASPEETPEIEITDIEDFPCFYGSLNDFTEDLLKAGNFSESPYVSMDGHSSSIKENNRKLDAHTRSTDAGVDASCKCLTTKGSSFNIEGEKSTADGGGQYTTDRTTPSASTSCFGDSSSDFSHGEGKSTDNCGGQYTTDGTTPSASTSCFGNPSSQEIFSSCESIFIQEESDASEEATNALVSLPEGAHIPAPKLKNIDRLRTIHYVYELPDTHPLLEQAEVREKDDPSLYLLAIWSPGEAPHSQQEIDEVCQEDLCKFYGASANETVSGTLLIPCRTAMRGSFPLNGTYFQVNEVFADHASSLRPFQVPRSHIWRLQRRFVYFGTSVSNIFRGLTSDEIKSCFLRGHVCVRGFDREKRTPKPLVCRLHFPISKQIQQRHKKDKTEASHTH